MAAVVTKVSIFVGSPGDVGAEREIVRQTVEDLNIAFAPPRRLVLELKLWETHVWPGFGEDAQDVINERIGEYEIFVGVFWNRFGTPTHRAGSGTEEEFKRAYEAWKATRKPSLLLYFRRTPAELSTLESLEQKTRLLGFKKALTDLGALFREYSELDEFRRLINIHLTQQLTALEKTEEVQRLHDRVAEQQETLTKQERVLEAQQDTINQLVTYSMASYIFKHLSWIYHGRKGDGPSEYLFHDNEPMRHDLRFLRDHGYIEFVDLGSLRERDNLVQRVKLTPVGNFYVELRESLRHDKGR